MQPARGDAAASRLPCPREQRQPVLANRGDDCRSAAAPVGAGSRRSASTIAPSRSVSRTRTERFAEIEGASSCGSRCGRQARRGCRPPIPTAADAMRAFCALPCRSATTRKASPASGSAASSMRAAAVGEQEASALAARLGDAVRPGVEEQGAGAMPASPALAVTVPAKAGRGSRRRRPLSPRPGRRGCAEPLACARKSPPVLRRSGTRRRSPMRKRDQPPFEIDAVAAKPAFGDQHGKLCGGFGLPCVRGLGHHVRQPHRQSELAHRFARRR